MPGSSLSGRGARRMASRVLPLACAALLGCNAPPAEEPASAPPPVAVTVAAVERGTIAETVSATGETAALTTVRLASPVAGRVTTVTVQPGDRVAAGAVAARVLPQENEAALHGFGVLEQAGALRAEERPAAARLARELAGRDIPLRVPFDGLVADRLHNPGEQVAPSDVLVEVFDPRSLVVVAQVPLDRSGDVRVGQPAVVRIGDTTVDGRVAAVVAAISAQSLTVPVRITLASPPQRPLLHAAADVRITVAVHDAALLLRRAALLADDHHARGSAMVVADGVARLRPVRLGLRGDETIEVLEGLAAGDVVVVAGQYGLPDGAAVVPQATGRE